MNSVIERSNKSAKAAVSARRSIAAVASLALLGACFTGHASAQTEPAFRFGEAPLSAPSASAVASCYGASSAHADGRGAGTDRGLQLADRGEDASQIISLGALCAAFLSIPL